MTGPERLVIRDARPEDFAFFWDSLAQTNRDHAHMRGDLYRINEWYCPENSGRNFLSKCVYAFNLAARKQVKKAAKIAVLDGERIGAVFIEEHSSFFDRWLGFSQFKKHAYVNNVYVLQAFRRKGVGLALIGEAKKWAAENDCPHIQAKILCNNDASLRLFKKAGMLPEFVLVGKILTP